MRTYGTHLYRCVDPRLPPVAGGVTTGEYRALARAHLGREVEVRVDANGNYRDRATGAVVLAREDAPSRVGVRFPPELRARVDAAARHAGLSLAQWLARAAERELAREGNGD